MNIDCNLCHISSYSQEMCEPFLFSDLRQHSPWQVPDISFHVTSEDLIQDKFHIFELIICLIPIVYIL